MIFGLKLYMSDDIWQLCLNLLRNDGWEHFFLNSGEGGILCSCTLCDLKIRDGIHLKNSIKLLVTYFFMVEFSQRLGNSTHFFFPKGQYSCSFAALQDAGIGTSIDSFYEYLLKVCDHTVIPSKNYLIIRATKFFFHFLWLVCYISWMRGVKILNSTKP